ncbi:DNA-binding transcriptional regulator, HxlR family [Actinomyces ruminicola]|uniref:DNA-binding transcriptional regulator, HxlR family n=1 Tax=Actinomyces ruminicola TaxID=332524 RepID=A0A1H0ASR0_9ACTO|nr:DNA-binding transcriptional regulator, HxlR family [Actinomyces ruminicola]
MELLVSLSRDDVASTGSEAGPAAVRGTDAEAPKGHPLTAVVATGAAGPVASYDVLSPECPSRTVLRHVVDRWTPLIVAVLAQGPRRFGELRQAVGGVTPKVLAQTLRSMERDGLVLRDQTPGVPPRVDYTLTPLGASLAEPIAALRAWAEGNAEQVLAHREAYDRAHSRSEE